MSVRSDAGPLTEPRFFGTAAWEAWLREHHASTTALVVGFYKVTSGQATMTWPESVDVALCFGWIDGVRKRIDDARYQIRFTPRKRGSIWSAVNIERVAVLTELGRMAPAGLAAFEARTIGKSRVYAYEQAKVAELSASDEAVLRADSAAWTHFSSRSASYRHKICWWIASAKQPATRARRLAALLDASSHGRML